MAQGMIMRRGGAAASGLPEFTYTGTYSLIDDGDGNWRIKFLTSGTFTPDRNMTIDVFLVGAGGGRVSHSGSNNYIAGAGSGYTSTYSSIALQAGVPYTITVGAGASGGTGGSSIFSNASLYIAHGGKIGSKSATTSPPPAGGRGGSGGSWNGPAGVDGSDGGGTNGGTGQHTTTREFAEPTGTLYATGGHQDTPQTKNTGNGNNRVSGPSISATPGMSGICVIRNHRAA